MAKKDTEGNEGTSKTHDTHRVTMSNEAWEKVENYCEATGLSYGEVIEIYLDNADSAVRDQLIQAMDAKHDAMVAALRNQ